MSTEIQDQVYDEGQNKVTIKVRCCDPEKMKNKIMCKAKGILICIEIIVPKPPDQKPKSDPKHENVVVTIPPPQPVTKPRCTDSHDRRHCGPCYYGCPNQWTCNPPPPPYCNPLPPCKPAPPCNPPPPHCNPLPPCNPAPPCNPPPPCGGYYYGYGRQVCEELVVARYDCQDNYGPPCTIM